MSESICDRCSATMPDTEAQTCPECSMTLCEDCVALHDCEGASR